MKQLIYLRNQTGLVHLAADEIIRFEGEGNYTYVWMADGRKYLFSKTISCLLEMIPEGALIRISKTHAVNPAFLESVFLRCRQRYVCLSSGERLEVSRRRAQQMRKDFKQRM